MDIELHPTVSLQEGTFNVLVAPPEMLIQAINTNQHIQQYKTLFVSGNFSRILGHLHRTHSGGTSSAIDARPGSMGRLCCHRSYLMYFLANVVMKAAHMNVPKMAWAPASHWETPCGRYPPYPGVAEVTMLK